MIDAFDEVVLVIFLDAEACVDGVSDVVFVDESSFQAVLDHGLAVPTITPQRKITGSYNRIETRS